jgi:hypothetical protein
MMAASPKDKAGRKGNRVSEKPNLASQGIDKNFANRAPKALT